MNAKLIVAVAVLAAAALGAPVAAQDDPGGQPYGNTTVDDGPGGWMDGVGAPSVGSLGEMLGRLGAFVIGNDPTDPGLGPMLTGLLVCGIVVGMVGTSRAGTVAGSVLGVTTVGVLSTSAGMFPTYIWGAAIIALGVVAASVIRRQFQ